MTVKELAARLQTCNEDSLIWLEVNTISYQAGWANIVIPMTGELRIIISTEEDVEG